jgi:hypothetical protein
MRHPAAPVKRGPAHNPSGRSVYDPTESHVAVRITDRKRHTSQEHSMRYIPILSLAVAAACAHSGGAITDPLGSGVGSADRVRVLGAIKGYNQDDPRIAVSASGRTVTVTVTTYGAGCHSRGKTEVSVAGLVAEIVPWDYTAPAGTPCTMQLLSFTHTATIPFASAGTATIRVRGIDAATRHAGNMAGTEITVERTVQLQ